MKAQPFGVRARTLYDSFKYGSRTLFMSILVSTAKKCTASKKRLAIRSMWEMKKKINKMISLYFVCLTSSIAECQNNLFFNILLFQRIIWCCKKKKTKKEKRYQSISESPKNTNFWCHKFPFWFVQAWGISHTKRNEMLIVASMFFYGKTASHYISGYLLLIVANDNKPYFLFAFAFVFMFKPFLSFGS